MCLVIAKSRSEDNESLIHNRGIKYLHSLLPAKLSQRYSYIPFIPHDPNRFLDSSSSEQQFLLRVRYGLVETRISLALHRIDHFVTTHSGTEL